MQEKIKQIKELRLQLGKQYALPKNNKKNKHQHKTTFRDADKIRELISEINAIKKEINAFFKNRKSREKQENLEANKTILQRYSEWRKKMKDKATLRKENKKLALS